MLLSLQGFRKGVDGEGRRCLLGDNGERLRWVRPHVVEVIIDDPDPRITKSLQKVYEKHAGPFLIDTEEHFGGGWAVTFQAIYPQHLPYQFRTGPPMDVVNPESQWWRGRH